MRIIIILLLLPFLTEAQKKIRISVPDGTSIDSTVLIGGWGIDAVESPANTWNVVADTSQLVTQYDITQKQDKLLSGTNIKTVNNNSLLGSGNISVGTVTSVAATGSTGISVSGSPITGSGTLTITNTAPHQATNLSLSQAGSVVTLGSSTGSGVTLTAGTNVGFSTSGPNTTINVTGGGGGGTVTSVGFTAGSGISLSGTNPINTTGNITITANDISDANELQTLSYNAGLRDLTISSGNTVNIPLSTTAAPGLTPTRPLTNQSTVFLRGDNTWATPAASGVTTNLSFGTPSTSTTYGYYVPITPATGTSVGVEVNLYGDDGMEVKKGSSNFAGYKLNQSYANLIRTTNTGVAITSTETAVDFTGGFENGNMTYSTVNDNITLTLAGTYDIEFSTTVYTTGTTTRRVEFTMYNSTNALPDVINMIQDVDAVKYETMSRSRVYVSNAGSTISIKTKYDNAIGSGTDIYYRYPSLKITRIK